MASKRPASVQISTPAMPRIVPFASRPPRAILASVVDPRWIASPRPAGPQPRDGLRRAPLFIVAPRPAGPQPRDGLRRAPRDGLRDGARRPTIARRKARTDHERKRQGNARAGGPRRLASRG